MQLSLDGGEVPVATARASARFALSPAQRELLRLGARPEGVTAREAGVVVHRHRTPPCRSCRNGASCQWAGTDGWEAMKRLRERGLVAKAPVRGAPYVTLGAVHPDDVAGSWQPAGRVLPYVETGVSRADVG